MTPDELQMTPGERLHLARRRLKLTQRDVAAIFGVPTYRYQQWEHDRGKDPPGLPLRGPIELFEWAWLMRRRVGVRLVDVSDAIGLHTVWVHRAEHGEVSDPSALVEWWKQQEAIATELC